MDSEIKNKGYTKKILKFTKVEHTLFSLPLLFTGAWMGSNGSLPSFKVMFLIVIAAIGARVFGMAFNRIFDKKMDAENPRTSSRELPAGELSVKNALAIAFAGLLIYIAACIILGGLCLSLSFLPVIPLFGYSLLKRFTSLCHFGIGLCLALAPLGAFVAASGTLDFTFPVLIFSLFVFCWMSASDIIYALMDIEFDRKSGVFSLPARLGSFLAQIIAATVHVVAVICIVVIVLFVDGGIFAWIALFTGIVAFVLMYVPKVPVALRFFPISSIAGIAGALAPIIG